MKTLSVIMLLFLSLTPSIFAKDYDVKAKVIAIEVNLSNSVFNKYQIRNDDFEQTIYVRRDATVANRMLLNAIDSQKELYFQISTGKVSYEYNGNKVRDYSTPELRQVSNLPLGSLP